MLAGLDRTRETVSLAQEVAALRLEGAVEAGSITVATGKTGCFPSLVLFPSVTTNPVPGSLSSGPSLFVS